jgi:hypothetical protein
MLATETTELAQLQLAGSVLFILRGVVVALLTYSATQRYLVLHNNLYLLRVRAVAHHAAAH